MIIELEIWSGSNHNSTVKPSDVQKNIDALNRAIKNNKRISDAALLIDTLSLLKIIQRKVREQNQ